MRIALVLLIGLALGFGAGWLAFRADSAPPRRAPTHDTAVARVEREFLQQIRLRNRDVDSVSCEPREGSAGKQFLCSAQGPSAILGRISYLVTVHAAGIDYRARVR